MEERIIDLETAKLAFECGFKLEDNSNNIKEWVQGYQLVTQNFLRDWLRKEHRIYCMVYPKETSIFTNRWEKFFNFNIKIISKSHEIINTSVNPHEYRNYEEILEVALQRSLKLIENEE